MATAGQVKRPDNKTERLSGTPSTIIAATGSIDVSILDSSAASAGSAGTVVATGVVVVGCPPPSVVVVVGLQIVVEVVVVFVVAGVTDALDGFIARHGHQVTHLGATLDPLFHDSVMEFLSEQL